LYVYPVVTPRFHTRVASRPDTLFVYTGPPVPSCAGGEPVLAFG